MPLLAGTLGLGGCAVYPADPGVGTVSGGVVYGSGYGYGDPYYGDPYYGYGYGSSYYYAPTYYGAYGGGYYPRSYGRGYDRGGGRYYGGDNRGNGGLPRPPTPPGLPPPPTPPGLGGLFGDRGGRDRGPMGGNGPGPGAGPGVNQPRVSPGDVPRRGSFPGMGGVPGGSPGGMGMGPAPGPRAGGGGGFGGGVFRGGLGGGRGPRR